MDLFGEMIISKGQLQRAALTFGKLATQKVGGPQHRQIAIEEIDRFNAAEAGRWNYRDLFSALVEVAKGGNPEHVIDEFKKLKGNGEAVSKVSLFRKIIDSTEIVGSEFIDANPVVHDLGWNVKLPLEYNVKFKRNGIIYCVLVLPRAEPLKQKTLNAITAEFAMPFRGMVETHKFVLAENPKINGKRAPKIGIYEFEYRKIDNDFREHLKISILAMNEKR